MLDRRILDLAPLFPANIETTVSEYGMVCVSQNSYNASGIDRFLKTIRVMIFLEEEEELRYESQEFDQANKTFVTDRSPSPPLKSND
jgi:hypothetical protein